MECRELGRKNSHGIIDARSLRFERGIDSRNVLDIDITAHGNRHALFAQNIPLLDRPHCRINYDSLLRVR